MTRAEQYRKNLDNKFDENGSVRYFPGNTVLSFIDHASPSFALFAHVRQMLTHSIAGECFAMLPDDSIHMTVFEGVCNQWRSDELWTSLLPKDAELGEVDSLFERNFAMVPKLGDVRMRITGITGGYGYALTLAPDTPADANKLRVYRNNMGCAFGLEFLNQETYRFHISICYGVHAPTAEQDAALDRFEMAAAAYIAKHPTVFDLQEPVMTYFRNMYRFEKVRFERP